MRLVTKLLLGSAAGFVSVAGAQAADMPVKTPPVQYVKICSLYGDGFFYIPGTDTCIKIGGFVRVQAEYNAGAGAVPVGSGTNEGQQGKFTRDFTNDVNFRNRAALSFDVRQQTQFGILRTYIRFGAQTTTPADAETPNNTVFFDRAFIQFAGFTVGRATSFFDIASNLGDINYNHLRVVGDTNNAGIGVTVWAYTAEFGNGFSGTLSLENPGGHFRDPAVDVSNPAFFAANATVNGDTAFQQQQGAAGNNNGFRVPDRPGAGLARAWRYTRSAAPII
jgi:hypothetical protein